MSSSERRPTRGRARRRPRARAPRGRGSMRSWRPTARPPRSSGSESATTASGVGPVAAEQRLEPAVDRTRRRARELLVADRPRELREVRPLRTAAAQVGGPDFPQHRPERLVAPARARPTPRRRPWGSAPRRQGSDRAAGRGPGAHARHTAPARVEGRDAHRPEPRARGVARRAARLLQAADDTGGARGAGPGDGRPALEGRHPEARCRRVARHRLAEGVRRPGAVADRAAPLRRRGPGGRRAAPPPHDQLGRADAHALRHADPEGRVPPADPRGARSSSRSATRSPARAPTSRRSRRAPSSTATSG